jgi:hypothetical protein
VKGDSSSHAGDCFLRRTEATRYNVHGVNRRWSTSAGERMAGEQPPQGKRVDPSPVQRRVEATPPTTVGWFEAQVDRRGHHLCGKDGIAEFEQRVGATLEAV